MNNPVPFLTMTGVAVVAILLWLRAEGKLSQAQRFEPKRDYRGRFVKRPINGQL